MREPPTRYCVEDDWAYYGDRCLDHADVENFVIHDERWASDGTRVYEGGREKRGIDGESFVHLNVVYGKDRKAAHTAAGPIKGSDPATFETLDSGYQARENRYASQLHCGGYARDKKRVYYNDTLDHRAHPLRGADPASFVSLGNGYGRDRKAVYLHGVPLPKADPARWTLLARGYSIDRDRAYYGAKLLEGVDPGKLFACHLRTTGRYASDGERFFWNDMVISPAKFYETIEEYPDTVAIIMGRWWPKSPAHMKKAGEELAARRYPPKRKPARGKKKKKSGKKGSGR
jgi:hypothetical protein